MAMQAQSSGSLVGKCGGGWGGRVDRRVGADGARALSAAPDTHIELFSTFRSHVLAVQRSTRAAQH
jgi:hypothetical protein